jgi:hypothetical protein
MVSMDWAKVTANLERTDLRQSPTSEVKVNTVPYRNYNKSGRGKITETLERTKLQQI